MAKGKYEYWLTNDSLLLLEAWARDGLTDELIAKKIGIRRETLYSWKKCYPNISNALKRGKEPVDIEVENALLKRALGYKYTETTQERRKNDDGDFELVTTKIVTKEVVPDTTAQIFWLKNRKRQEWQDSPKDSQFAANADSNIISAISGSATNIFDDDKEPVEEDTGQ